MTVSTTQIRVSYTGDGSSVNFPVPFPFYLITDLLVLQAGSAIASGYSVTGGAGNPGTLTMSVAPGAGVSLQIVLNVPLTQLVNLVDGTAFPSATINQVNDRAVQAELRLNDLIGRSIRAPDGDVSPAMLLPTAAARALLWLAFDAGGNLSLQAGLPPGTTLSTAVLAPFLGLGITNAEIAAGVTPSNFSFPPGHVLRYGTNTVPGVTDMTVPLQAVVNQWSHGGAEGRASAGTYFHASAISLPATASGRGVAGLSSFVLKGDGQGMTVITTSNNVENFSTTGASATNFLFQPTFQDLEIANTFAASGSPQVGASVHNVHLQNPQNARIIRCHLRGAFTDASPGTAANHAGVWFDNQGYAGAFLNEVVDCWIDHAHVTMDTSDSIVRDSFIWGNGTDYAVKVNNANITVVNNFDINGFTATSGHGAVWNTINGSNTKILNNFFDAQCTYGVWSDGNLMQLIQGNIFWENPQAAIHAVNANFVSIQGNLFLNCGTNNTGLLCSDIVFDSQAFSDFNTVIGNLHFRTGATTNAYGIYEFTNGASTTLNRYIGNVYADAGGGQYNSPAIFRSVTLRNGTPGSVWIGNVGKGAETEVYSSFVGTYTGFTVAFTNTIQYTREGNKVTLTIPQQFGTSNATTFTITGLPASIQPAFTQIVPCVVEDNNVPQLGAIQVTNSGTITVSLGSNAAWTNTGNRAMFGAFNFTYQLT